MPDNLLYETDFPHPTSIVAGPASVACVPKDFIEGTMADFPEDLPRKIPHDNASAIYHVEE